jgi:hypothetical protein
VARHLILLAGLLAGAVQAQEPPRVVEVKGMKDPQMRSYRAIAAGLDAFDKHHGLAPGADQLRFRLTPTDRNQGASVDGITMHIVGKGDAIAVPIDADGAYTIPRIEAARDDNADLILNRKRDLFKGSVQVRTPGLAPNVRRLGDLRLECQAMVAIVKEEIPFYLNAFINGVFLTADWCNTEGFEWDASTAQRLSGATLVSGQRRMAIKVKDARFTTIVADRSWPDDALVELEFAESGSPPAEPQRQGAGG